MFEYSSKFKHKIQTRIFVFITEKMSSTATGIPTYGFKLPNPHHLNKPILLRWRGRSSGIRCSVSNNEMEKGMKKKNYYELLGVSVDSDPQQIKEAYRKLQKKHHPDIAGHQGHEYTLMLNKAYKVLMREEVRKEYDASIGQSQVGFGIRNSGLGFSSWKGPLRPQALFVDQNACIGCRECVHYASNTFTMDESLGCARVKVQYGDDDTNIEVSVESCPVNCIHWVETEELAVLEYLSQPQPKEGYGIFGQGWERPANVFTAAKYFDKQKIQRSRSHDQNARSDIEQETPAQAQARASAISRLESERFLRFWNWLKEFIGQ